MADVQQTKFITDIAVLVQKHAPTYGIKVFSPIIAQGFLESADGTSNKVKNKQTGEIYNNYFGLKWNDNRLKISNDYFIEWGSEQQANGSYYEKKFRWCKFKSMEDCVIGYLQFIDTPRYKNLKGVTDPETYLQNIKADGYATSIDYVKKVMNVIKKYNLTIYDNVSINNSVTVESGDRKMVINVHAGHNADGYRACGAVGLIKESTEAREVVKRVIKTLTLLGHTVYDCTVDNAPDQATNLRQIVSKCNAHKVDLDISVHFNAGARDMAGNGKTTGVEVLVYSAGSKAMDAAKRVASCIGTLGYRNRGVKARGDLYVLKNTKAPAMLVECCFVDDADDVRLYNADKMAAAIVRGITGT